MQEIEVKLRLPSLPAIRRRLRALGFERATPRRFERNLLFDRLDGSLRRTGQVLRLRSKGRQWWLTWKAPSDRRGRHKRRQELEVEASPGALLPQILGRLGLFPVLEYQKYRTEYRHPRGKGLALVDETPLGAFLELEGPPRWIDRTAAQLGFSPSDYILESYVALHFADCARRGAPPGDMVFR